MLTRPLTPRLAAVLAAGAALVLAACGSDEPAWSEAHGRLACTACHRLGTVTTNEGRAGVPDASCTSRGCHEDAGGDSVRLGMVTFLHKQHQAGGGRHVTCAACHTHGADDRQLAPDPSACALCHRQQLAADPGCARCHPSPRHERQTSEGIAISHVAVSEARVSCTSCHYDVTDGTGAVQAAKCASCHEQYGDTTALPAATAAHEAHEMFACTACHAPFRHRIVAMSASVNLVCTDCHSRRHRRPIPEDTSATAACEDCHRETHTLQQRLMLGAVPNEPLEPTVMFMGGLTCRSCHVRQGTAPPAPGVSLRGNEATCIACHGTEWSGVLSRWNRGWERRRGFVTDYLAAAQRAVDGAGRPAPAVAQLASASARVARVDSARPAHNLEVADRLLREALASATAAYHAAGLMPPAPPQLGPPATRGSCMSCHYGVEEAAAELDPTARPVTHAQHMFRAPQPCEACHAAGAAPPGISDSLWIDTARAPRRRQR